MRSDLYKSALVEYLLYYFEKNIYLKALECYKVMQMFLTLNDCWLNAEVLANHENGLKSPRI